MTIIDRFKSDARPLTCPALKLKLICSLGLSSPGQVGQVGRWGQCRVGPGQVLLGQVGRWTRWLGGQVGQMTRGEVRHVCSFEIWYSPGCSFM